LNKQEFKIDLNPASNDISLDNKRKAQEIVNKYAKEGIAI